MFKPKLFTSKLQFLKARDQFARWYKFEIKDEKIKPSVINEKFANLLGCKDFDTALTQLEAAMKLTPKQKEMIENAEKFASKTIHLPMTGNQISESVKAISLAGNTPRSTTIGHEEIIRSITKPYSKTPISMVTAIKSHRSEMFNGTECVNCEVRINDLSDVITLDCRDYLYHLHYYGQLEKEVLALLEVEGCKRQALESLAEYYEDAGKDNSSLTPLAKGALAVKNNLLHERTNQCGFSVAVENGELIDWVSKMDDIVFYSILTKLSQNGHPLTNNLRITIECSHGSKKIIHRKKAKWERGKEGEPIGHTVEIEIHSIETNKIFNLDGETWRELNQHENGIEVYTLALFKFGMDEKDILFALED